MKAARVFQKWTEAMFISVIWYMLGQPGHFVTDFKRKYEDVLHKIYIDKEI